MAQTARQLDAFNQQLRANPQYQAFLRSLGVDPEQPVQLSDAQRKQAEAWVRRNVADIGDLEIDPAGNANQNEGFGKQLKTWGPIAGAGALAAFGMPGVFPGLLTKGGATAASASGATSGGLLPSASIPGLHAAVPGAISGAGAAGAASVPLGGVLPKVIGDGGTAGSYLSKIGGGVKEFVTDPGNLVGLGTVIAGLMGGRGGSNTDDTEELRRIQQITEARMRRTDPLHQVATNLAFGRMPTNYRQGVQLTNVPLPPER